MCSSLQERTCTTGNYGESNEYVIRNTYRIWACVRWLWDWFIKQDLLCVHVVRTEGEEIRRRECLVSSGVWTVTLFSSEALACVSLHHVAHCEFVDMVLWDCLHPTREHQILAVSAKYFLTTPRHSSYGQISSQISGATFFFFLTTYLFNHILFIFFVFNSSVANSIETFTIDYYSFSQTLYFPSY